MARLRGQSDAIALRLRHHDDRVHAARMPARREAKDAYDALEQVRVEVVGAQHMSGVHGNLRAKLAEECEQEGFDRMTRKDQMPIDKALALLARERLSGEQAPEAAQRILSMWRDTLGDNADVALAEMTAARQDQNAFPAPPANFWPLWIWPKRRSSRNPTTTPTTVRTAANNPASRKTPSKAKVSPSPNRNPCSVPIRKKWEGEAADDDGSDSEEEAAVAEGDDGPAVRSHAADRGGPDAEGAYRAYTRGFDEEIDAEELCDADELSRLRQQLDQQLQQSARRDFETRQSPAAEIAGAANPGVGVRSR